jgi:hypothetical protein
MQDVIGVQRLIDHDCTSGTYTAANCHVTTIPCLDCDISSREAITRDQLFSMLNKYDIRCGCVVYS